MTKTLLSLAVLGSVLFSGAVRAQQPMDYYRAGVVQQLLSNENYLAQYAAPGALLQMLRNQRRFFVAAGATPAVLAAYDRMAQTYLSLPVATSFPYWSPAQRSAFTAARIDFPTFQGWLGASMGQPSFFFWLGSHITFLAQIAPLDLSIWHLTLAGLQNDYRVELSDFPPMVQYCPTSMALLKPDVRNAMVVLAQDAQAIAARGQGITPAMVRILQQHASVIVQAAANGGSLTQ